MMGFTMQESYYIENESSTPTPQGVGVERILDQRIDLENSRACVL